MNEAIIIYGSILVIFALSLIVYINYQEKTKKDKKIGKTQN